uniref:Cleavage and polyadenylation specificity factor subunit 2 n=1 Tax=Romanomermis culicivorax TaxID=13658 RepID=A0A915IT43_ROMCU
MTSIIKLEALSGVYDDSPLCYILQVDEFHFLLDCGWDDSFDSKYMESLRKRVHQIDAVLLSYADTTHIGALPYLAGRCGLNCPIYATVPVYKMGQMFMYDWYQSHQNFEDFQIFNLDDVDTAFDKVQQLKYSQNVQMKGKGHGLQITPLPAGHMIGGTIWRITKMGEEEIVYAVDFNHKKERHLNGCNIESIGRPNLLITDAFNADYNQSRRKNRDEQLLTNILQTVRNGGNVLIVIDTAGRVLELAQLLDQLWHNAEAGLITYNLVMMNNVAYNVIEFAKSQMEWMSDKVLRSFEEGRYNPFQFRHLQLCHSMIELNRIRSPKVVLTSSSDMECGFSRELFLDWCTDPKNSIILTLRGRSNTLASRLTNIINAKDKSAISRILTLEIRRRVRLEGAELDEYWRQKKEKEQHAARIRLESQRRSHRIDTIESSDESGDDDADNSSSTLYPYDVMYKFEQQQKSSCFKQAKKAYPMYPFVEEKLKWDDYGEIINPEDYTIAEMPVPSAAGIKSERELNESLSGKSVDGPSMTNNEVSTVDVPTKCIKYVQKLEALCKIAFIDFEGRSDGESVKTRVFAPKLGEVIDATIESHIFQVTLTDVLMSSLQFQPVKDAELAWVDSRVNLRKNLALSADLSRPALLSKSNAGDSIPNDADQEMMDILDDMLPKTSSSSTSAAPQSMNVEVSSVLDVLPQSSIPTHTAVFVNDPKLSDLKQLLMLAGFQAEFSAGVLYVNNAVAIRRNEAGKLHFEGAVGEEYFRIRDMIYKQYAIV